ncbi:MAG: enoyl-CoA hydratase [Deltaproteobacteria bacterium]|nr:enoyl-CoA hydratase [Deltaproteobacteria bacterium]
MIRKRNVAADRPGEMLARKEGPLGWIIFSNPQRRNAVSNAMWEQIPGLIAEFEQDSEVRVILLRGEGDQAFVSGADIMEFDQMRSNAKIAESYDAKVGAAVDAISNAAKPTIAMIHGWCMGGGVAIAMGCDLRMASDTARFGIPAARLGVGYSPRGIAQMLELVGPAYTREIFYTARIFSAEEFLQMGMLNTLFPRKKLEAQVKTQALSIAANAPLSVQAIGLAIRELLKEPSRQDMKAVKKAMDTCFDSEDFKEGRRAFLEKRLPVFKGS